MFFLWLDVIAAVRNYSDGWLKMQIAFEVFFVYCGNAYQMLLSKKIVTII